MKNRANWHLLWGLVLVLAWSAILTLFLRSHGDLSVRTLLQYQPKEPFLAALTMLGLFLLKSVDFIMISNILYALSGILFPMPIAVAMNLLGAAIMVSVPYALGRSLGPPIVSRLLERYPKLEILHQLRDIPDLLLITLIRLIGLPLIFVSLYFGAVRMSFRNYVLGSVLGLIPSILTATVMGDKVGDRSSPVFWIALGCHFLIVLISAFISLRLRRSTAKKEAG